MNITLFKKYTPESGNDNSARFASDIFHSYNATPVIYCSGMFSDHTDGKKGSGDESSFGYITNADYKLKGDITAATVPISYEEIEEAEGMFFGQSAITSVKIDFPSVKNMCYMFAVCRALEKIESKFDSITGEDLMYGNIRQTSVVSPFYECNNLKTFKVDFPNLVTNGSSIFAELINVETIKSDLSSLTNGDNLFANSTMLKNLDCDFSSLESAINLCKKAKLTIKSIDNIAKKIKTHDTAENHRIDLGLKCPNQNDYIFGWAKKINEIKSKNWDVHVYSSAGEELTSNGYENTLNLSGNKILTVSSISTENNLDYITGNEVSGQKCGFIIVSNDKDIAVNRVAIKTASNYGTTQRNIFLQVRDHNKNIIAKSRVTTVSAPSTEYVFKFDDPFIIEQNTVDSNGNNTKKYYFELYAEGNTSKRAEFNIAFCDVEYGCGALYNSEPSSWNQQWSREDDNHPTTSPDPSDDPQRTAWSKFYLEADSKVEEIDLTTVKPKITKIENSIYNQEIKLKLDFSIEDENVTIGDTNILHFKNLETSEILEEAPVNITTSLLNTKTIEVILTKKDNIIGNFMGVIEIHGSNNETYYKSFEFDII